MKSIISAALLFAVTLTSAQEWERGATENLCTGLALDSLGRPCVLGFGPDTVEDISITKYDGDGTLLWDYRYDSPEHARDRAYGIAVDARGYSYISGLVYLDTAELTVTQAVDSLGELDWQQRRCVPESTRSSGRSVALDKRGKVYNTGYSGTRRGPYWVSTVCYDTSGSFEWAADYYGPSGRWNLPWDIVTDEYSNVYVCAQSENLAGDHDFAVIKYDSAGTELWVARYDGPGHYNDTPFNLVIDREGSVYAFGNSYGVDTETDWALVKYDSAGTQQWVRRVAGFGRAVDFPGEVCLDSSGNVICCGSLVTDSGYYDIAVAKYSPDGDSLWQFRLGVRGGISGTTSRAVAVGDDNRVCVTSNYSLNYIGGWVTFVLDSSGTLVWSHEIARNGRFGGETEFLALDSIGNIYVAGSFDGSRVLLKYGNPFPGVAEESPSAVRWMDQSTVMRSSGLARTDGRILDATGREVTERRFQPGVYFLVPESSREVRKVIVAR